MKIIQEWKEFLELLNSENVQYLVIGGWAYNKYCTPRTTGDIDFFVSSSKENQLKLRKVLEKFGFAESLPPANEPLFRKKIIMLGVPPNRIDLLIKISGITFDDAYKNKEKSLLSNIPTFFISKNDLIKNKLESARDKDLLDIKNLRSK